LSCVSQNATNFSGKKPKFEYRKWIFKEFTHITLCEGINSCNFWLQFSNFSLPKNFLEDSLKVFQALPFVEFNFVLYSWSSNSCVICLPTKSSFFLLGLNYSVKNLALISKPLALTATFTGIFIKRTLISHRVEYNSSCPIKQFVPLCLTLYCYWKHWLFSIL
jgi:hypothetical protein